MANDLVHAASVASATSPTNAVESNYVNYINLYVSYASNRFKHTNSGDQQICDNVKWDTVVVKEDPLSFGDLNNADRGFRIAPNPAADHITIHSPQPNLALSVTIFDLSGRAVLHRELQAEGNFATLELSLPGGAYLLRISNQRNEQTVRKLIVAR